jgi:CO/xanthine dehydrogenase Mo-binding subunit
LWLPERTFGQTVSAMCPAGLVTSYKQLVSDQLGVDADRVDVLMGDTDRTPSGLTGGSRALAVAGAALYEAGRFARTSIDQV